MTSHLSTLTLHQLRYGELEAEQAASARLHLESCERCAGLLQRQHAAREEFVLKPMPQALKDLGAANAEPWWRKLLVWGTPALALAALLLIAPRALLEEPAEGPAPEVVTAKGGVHLEAWVDTDEGPRVLDDGAELAPGDVVQLKFNSEGRRYVHFAGVDGSGEVEVYGRATADGEGLENAPFALTLDETPGTQRFVAVFSDEELAPAEFVDAVRNDRAPKEGILRALTFRKKHP